MFRIKKKYSDDEIISGLRNNDPAVFEYFYNSIKQMVYSYILANNGTVEDAQDICHDSVLIFFRQLKFKNLILYNSYSTYIYSIARNLWHKQLRRMNRLNGEPIDFEALECESILKEIDADFVAVIKNKIFWKHFNELMEDCKKILKLSFQKMPDDKIVKELGMSCKEDYIKRKSRCKYYLIESVKKDPLFTQVFDYES